MIAGVIESIEPAGAQGATYQLSTGTVVVDVTRDEGVWPPGGSSGRVGDLLIVGRDDPKIWYVVVPAGPPSGGGRPCFSLHVTGVDRGQAIDTSIGVQLPKAPDFDRGPDTNGVYEEQPHSFCLDERGTIYRWL
jgi:hypothetical protein